MLFRSSVKDLILSEVNVKNIEFADEKSAQIVKNLKLNFKTLGKKYGKHMKAIQAYASTHAQEIISAVETNLCEFQLEGEKIVLEPEDVEIIPVDIPGWKVANMGNLTVALDISISPELKEEGIARELVNRIQNLRKDSKYEVTDKIKLRVQRNNAINSAIDNNLNYICAETLAVSLEMVNEIRLSEGVLVEVDDEIKTIITIHKIIK